MLNGSVVQQIIELRKLQLTQLCLHAGDDLRRTRLARLGMMKVIKRQLHGLGIKYTLPLTPAAAPYLGKPPA